MSLSPTGRVRLAFFFRLGQFRAAVTRTFRMTAFTNGGPAWAPQIISFWNDYSTSLLDVLAADAEMQGIALYATDYPPTLLIHSDFGGPFPGQRGSASLPPQVCGKVSLWPSHPHAKRLGSMHLPFPPASDNTAGGSPSAGYLSALGPLRSQLLLATTASDTMPSPPFLPRTITYKADLPKPPGALDNLVIGTAARPLWSTQRRRATIAWLPNWLFS